MIAVDTMGGDYAPHAIVQGAYNAACHGISVGLFGDSQQIQAILDHLAPASSKKAWRSLPITLFHTTQVIAMDSEPGRAVLKYKDSSLVAAVQAVADGKAQAIVSAGNSGAALVAGTLVLGRVDGVERPAIGAYLPTKQGSIFCLDMGANTDCKPEYLEQFAYMGHAYVSLQRGVAKPRIALLSNGAEPYKGNQATKQAYALLEESAINFVGNLEARDIFDDKADVLVCDGFAGNILLKSVQGTARAMVAWIDQARAGSWLYTFGLLLSKGLFKGLKNKIDYAKKGGALLLGVRHPLIVAHGCSNAEAIEHAIMFANQVVQDNFVPRFNAQVSSLLATSKATFVGAQKVAHFEHVQQ
jgi:glycerol-3-phosphate acyltransferase PlsX